MKSTRKMVHPEMALKRKCYWGKYCQGADSEQSEMLAYPSFHISLKLKKFGNTSYERAENL